MHVNKIFRIVGSLCFILSMYQAFILKYNHFYEFLLLSMFLILYTLIPKELINNKIYFKIYLISLIVGLIGDLFIGIILTNLWHYTYTSFIEYMILYLFVYPFGGFVMIQSYLFLKSKTKTSKKKYDLNILKKIFYFTISITIILTILFLLKMPHLEQIFSAFIISTIFFYFSYKSEKKVKQSLIGDLVNDFKTFFIIIIVVTYVNAFIHEYPNVFANQWTYNTWLIKDITLFKIPIDIFFLGWFILTLIPVSIYYYAFSLNKKKLKNLRKNSNKSTQRL